MSSTIGLHKSCSSVNGLSLYRSSENLSSGHTKYPVCDCCPYGYHIDLDFVRFCEQMAKGTTGDSASKQRRRERRRQRQSMDVMLGLASHNCIYDKTFHIPEEKKHYHSEGVSQPLRSPETEKDELQKAVLDFEETLQKSNQQQEYNCFNEHIHYIAHPLHGHKEVTKSPIKQWLFNENSCKERSASKISYANITNDNYNRNNGLENIHSPLSETSVMLVSEATIASPDLQDCDGSSNASNLSSGALQNIREQMASSLEKMKYLEDQIKIIPILQEQLHAIKQEKEMISQQLNKELENANKIIMTTKNENLQPFRTYHTLPLKSVSDKMISLGLQKEVNAKLIGKTLSPSTREMGVSCSVMTRDIGINHIKPKQSSVATSTSTDLISQQAMKNNFPKMVSAAILTELKMNEIYSDLDFKRFEKSFHEKLSTKMNDNRHNKYIQTSLESLKIIEKRDKEVQTDFKKLLISTGVTAKQKMCDAETQDKLLNNMKMKCNLCEHSSKDRVNLSTSDSDTNISLSLRSMGMTKSKSFAYDDFKFLSLPRNRNTRSVACGSVKSLMDSKSTDTKDLRMKLKDTGINTTTKHYVDVAVGGSINDTAPKTVICDKCISESNTCVATSTPPKGEKASAVTSRIPRPTNAIHTYNSMHSPERNKLIKQDTNAKITAEKNQIQDSFTPIKNSASTISNLNLKNICASSSEDCGEDGTKASGDHASLSDSNFFKPIQVNQRKTAEPSKEMLAAMKVLSDALQKSPTGSVPHLFKTAINIIQQEWFKISSVASANPLDVEDYLDCFEDFSSRLLEYIVNMADISGNTAMHYAVSHGNFDVVSILLDSKVCNINQPNAAGYTCVMLVSLADVYSDTHRQVVRRLFQLADVNMRATQHGQTALMLAVSHGRVDMVQLLLESGADVNIQDEDGSTALMCAAEHHHIDVVKLLLAHPDCDLSVTDYDGSTALNIAMEAGHRDIGVLLYAQEHFSRSSSPYASLKSRRSKSVTPTLKSVHN